MRDRNQLSESVSRGLKEHERRETSFGCLAILVLFVVFPIAWIVSGLATENIASGFIIEGIITIVVMLLLRSANR